MSDEEEEYSDEYNEEDDEITEPITGREIVLNPIGLTGGGGLGIPFGAGNPGEVVQQEKEPADDLTWIAASDGHIPEGAVIGGWSSTTQEPYYIGRARSEGIVYHGVVLKSTKSFYSCFLAQNLHNNRRRKGKLQNFLIESNYEVLVNNGELSWVFVNTSNNNNNNNNVNIPVSAIELSSTAFPNIGYWLARTSSPLTGDTIVGVFMNSNTFTCYENHAANSMPYHVNTFLGYEVLCFCKSNTDSVTSPLPSSSPPPPPSVVPSIKSCFLYGIKYDIDSASADWSCVKLDEVVLINKSSVVQTNMMPSFNLSLPMTFNWEIPNTIDTEVHIKGKVPFVFGGKENHRIQLLDSQKFNSFVNPHPVGLVGNTNPFIHILYGGYLPNTNSAGGLIMPLGGAQLMQNSGIKAAGIFTPIVVIINDLSEGLHCEKHTTCNNTSFTVPSLSKVTVEYTGQEVTLSVPFKATLKIIYRNDCVHDEEVHGTYKHTFITASFPTVVGEKTTLY